MKKNKLIPLLITIILVACLVYYLINKRNNGLTINNKTNCENIDISALKSQAKIIDNNRLNYATKSKDIFGKSTQGGDQVNYGSGSNVVLKEQNFYGETGRSEARYYLSDGKVFYFIKKNIEYNNSIYDDQSGSVKKIDIKEFYLDKNQDLCSWYLNQSIQTVDTDTKDLVNSLISGL